MISTHVLDTALGRPAAGVAVRLEALAGGAWRELGSAVTDANGRVGTFGADPIAGHHRLTFDTGAYFASGGRPAFFPEVTVTFAVTAPEEHHHVPILLSPFGFSTYRGS